MFPKLIVKAGEELWKNARSTGVVELSVKMAYSDSVACWNTLVPSIWNKVVFMMVSEPGYGG